MVSFIRSKHTSLDQICGHNSIQISWFLKLIYGASPFRWRSKSFLERCWERCCNLSPTGSLLVRVTTPITWQGVVLGSRQTANHGVVRNYKGRKSSEYAPEERSRYDGIYKVVKYWPEKNKNGFIVCSGEMMRWEGVCVVLVATI